LNFLLNICENAAREFDEVSAHQLIQQYQDRIANIENAKRNAAASTFAAVVLETPSSMLNLAIRALLIGLAIYLGFL
jgi:hypothetical protein